jgi:hypothetical protein
LLLKIYNFIRRRFLMITNTIINGIKDVDKETRDKKFNPSIIGGIFLDVVVAFAISVAAWFALVYTCVPAAIVFAASGFSFWVAGILAGVVALIAALILCSQKVSCENAKGTHTHKAPKAVPRERGYVPSQPPYGHPPAVPSYPPFHPGYQQGGASYYVPPNGATPGFYPVPPQGASTVYPATGTGPLYPPPPEYLPPPPQGVYPTNY